MDVIQISLFVAIILGIGLVIFSLLTFSNQSNNKSFGDYEIENSMKALNTSLEEVDSAMLELDKMSKTIFEELDTKYQELLFLYTLIDEKKKEVAEIYSTQKLPQKEIVTSVDKDSNTYKNPKLHEINNLLNEGLSISEIAKELNMGQGEVKLIIGLGKVQT